MPYNKRKIGHLKENIAVEYLENKGYKILETNYLVRQAEIDIVAYDMNANTYVFVEVKYRDNDKSGHPLEAVNISKQKQICKAALFYLNKNMINPYTSNIRFDVIGILKEEITHIENAFYYIG